MKRWVLLTLLLYSLCLSIVVVPLFLAFSGDKGLLQFFFIWFFPVLLLVQGVLLLVPIAVIRERPVKRRNMVISVVVGAIPMAALALGFFGCIALMFWGEDTVDNFLYS